MVDQPQAKQQHPVPQEVFGVQFKLVGDLTVRQFGVLAISGVLAFIFFSSNLFIVLRLLLSGFFLLVGVAFAFVPVQDQTLDKWIVAFFKAVYAPTRRVWVKGTELPSFLVLETPKVQLGEKPEVSKEESQRKLKTYLETVREEAGDLSPLDLEERQYLQAINQLSQEVTAQQVSAAPSAPPPTLAPTAPEAPPEPEGEAAQLEAPKPPTLRPKEPKEEEAVEEPREFPSRFPDLKFIEVQQIKKSPSLASKINWTSEKVYKVQRGEEAHYFTTRQNVRVGRRLTPLAISGESVYAPAKERIIEPVEDLKPPELPPTPMPQPQFAPPPPAPPQPQQEVEEPKEEEKILEEPKPQIPSAPEAPPPPELPKLPAVQKKSAPKKPKLTPKGRQPGAIIGTVYNGKGGVVEQQLITIKDQKGNVVRATKTNELGRFSTTPLPLGKYSLEIPKSKVPFATMEFELTGEEPKEFEIKPKS